jgi:putative FmdB family regulatory protein
MPIYDFKCEQCGTVEEVLCKTSDGESYPKECSHCGHPHPVKLVSPLAFKLGGTGWAADNYTKRVKSAFED